MNSPTIPRTHANQAQVNLDILNFVADNQPATYADLFAQFKDANGDNEVNAHRRFSKRLEHLVDKGQLASLGRGHSRSFTLGTDATRRAGSAASVARDLKAVALPAPDCCADSESLRNCANRPVLPIWMKPWATLQAGQVALPPSINVMAADYPLYKAPPSPAVRPGALNYQSVASRGDRC